MSAKLKNKEIAHKPFRTVSVVAPSNNKIIILRKLFELHKDLQYIAFDDFI